MQLIQGASICLMDGKRVGRIDRVVIDPKTKSVTHLVIHTGALIGQDKVVPMDSVRAGEQDQPVLRLNASQLVKMPDFGMTHYSATSLHVEQPLMRGTRVNIPAGTVAVKEGAEVISSDGKHLSRVERVLTSPSTEQAAYFQISKRWRVKERKLVPFEWVCQLDEDQLRLAVGVRAIQDLPE